MLSDHSTTAAYMVHNLAPTHLLTYIHWHTHMHALTHNHTWQPLHHIAARVQSPHTRWPIKNLSQRKRGVYLWIGRGVFKGPPNWWPHNPKVATVMLLLSAWDCCCRGDVAWPVHSSNGPSTPFQLSSWGPSAHTQPSTHSLTQFWNRFFVGLSCWAIKPKEGSGLI